MPAILDKSGRGVEQEQPLGAAQDLRRALLNSDGFLESLPVGIYVCDGDGYLVHYNRRASELWGIAPDVGKRDARFCGSHKAYDAAGAEITQANAPMAEVLATSAPIRDREIVLERPDGSLSTVLANLEPLFGKDGTLIGAVSCFQDISERKAAEARFKASEEWFHGLLDALPAAVYTTDAQGRLTFFNRAATSLAGRRPELGTDYWCISWKLYTADGKPLRHEDCPLATALKTGEPIRGEEIIAERPDGTRVPILPFPTPLKDGSGRVIGAVNMLLDISERKAAEEQRTVLLRELAHRVNNTFAVILAITQQSLRTAPSPQAFADTFTARLQSLARAHSLLLAQGWAGVDLEELAREQIAPFKPKASDKLKIEGPKVMLKPAQVMALGAVLHELATNAYKFGALSVPNGSVALGWSLTRKDGLDHVLLNWQERGGPQVQAPTKKGLGSRIIQRGLPNATIAWRFPPEGVVCDIDLALDTQKQAGPEARDLKVPVAPMRATAANP